MVVPRTGLEPARLSTLAPETSASTIPPPGHSFRRRAENEARTRDPDLGKVVLYQLSYFRICFFCEEKETRTPTTQLSLPPQSSASTNSAISPRLSEVCPEQDSNLHVSQHSHLKRARLPFRHLGILSEEERKTRLELATPTLARSCSTN